MSRSQWQHFQLRFCPIRLTIFMEPSECDACTAIACANTNPHILISIDRFKVNLCFAIFLHFSSASSDSHQLQLKCAKLINVYTILSRSVDPFGSFRMQLDKKQTSELSTFFSLSYSEYSSRATITWNSILHTNVYQPIQHK